MKTTIAIEIEYDGEALGPNWLNPDNVALCLHAYCPKTKFEVRWAPGDDHPGTLSPRDARALRLLRRLEWCGHGYVGLVDVGAMCPICDGLRFDYTGGEGTCPQKRGHKPDCELANTIAEFEAQALLALEDPESGHDLPIWGEPEPSIEHPALCCHCRRFTARNVLHQAGRGLCDRCVEAGITFGENAILSDRYGIPLTVETG